ncbi:translational elongation factor EF-1 alpha [Ceratobasidium sp. 394]|nr:translational elongation factor EF-1 alpha [Ceratobasidium sp. 394]
MAQPEFRQNSPPVEHGAVCVADDVCLESCVSKAAHPAIRYAARLAVNLLGARNFDFPAWEGALVPYLEFVTASPEHTSIARELLLRSANEADGHDNADEKDDEGEELCNCQFSLAYGAKILLNAANLRLKRGHRYGLCGRNGSGKSTLMCAIAKSQVEGFPSPDEVRTFYVEHDIDSSDTDTSVLQFILQDKRVLCDRRGVVETLESLGFNDERQGYAIGSLSGGWKTKRALARAMLFKADILLLDEPTNHLDVVNVAWLENYLTSLKTCTLIIVSHDSGFLNNTITDVLHLNHFKIKRYRGNLEAFVKAVPEAKSCYSLEAAEDYKFKLPDPPLLEGVKTKEKPLLKMRKVGFQYPMQQVQQLYDITLQVSLSSRVAVLGPNGSGKSTLVKLLIGDMEPNKGGEVWKHPNLVIGYVAQHAFHHIDHHLDKTLLEYMLSRYQTGEDLEEMNKANSADEKKMKEGGVVLVEGVKRLIDEIVSRKKLKHSYEYESRSKTCLRPRTSGFLVKGSPSVALKSQSSNLTLTRPSTWASPYLSAARSKSTSITHHVCPSSGCCTRASVLAILYLDVLPPTFVPQPSHVSLLLHPFPIPTRIRTTTM